MLLDDGVEQRARLVHHIVEVAEDLEVHGAHHRRPGGHPHGERGVRHLGTELAAQPRQVLQVSSLSSLIRACEAGLGLALLPCLLGESSELHRLSAGVELV